MIFPPFLRKGDKVAVVATAKKADQNNLRNGIETIKSWGLSVVEGNCLYTPDCFFAGSDQHRLHDIQVMIDDPDIKAIFIARGGYGTSRILDQIDFRNMVKYPKWVCGFSDVTVLQLHLFNLNFSSMHCPMPAFFHVVDEDSINRMHDVLFGKNIPINTKSHKLNTSGNAMGRIIGGNLSMICHTLGTKTEIETDGRILFLEEVGESLYKIDRMMVQLKRSGKLKGIKGLIVGQFSEIDPTDDAFGKDVNEIIHDHIEPGKYPVAYDFPIGHTNLNYTIPIGAKAELVVKENVDVMLIYQTE